MRESLRFQVSCGTTLGHDATLLPLSPLVEYRQRLVIEKSQGVRVRLQWDGLHNARDLGGLALQAGGRTPHGVYARSDHPLHLTPEGWEQLADYGIHTIASLETAGLDGEAALRSNRPIELPHDLAVEVLRLPVEDATDQEFMAKWARTGLWGTPLYFADALQRWPRLYGDAINALALADGPVLFHCGRGHDRTGIVALLLLTLGGVRPEAIAEDYLLSSRNLEAQDPRSVQMLENALRDHGITAYAAIAAAIGVVDAKWLDRAGVRPDAIAALRARFSPDATSSR